MIPLKDYNPTRNFPLVTLLLVLGNVLVFIADRLSGHYERVTVQTAQGAVRVLQFVGGYTEHYALVPADLSSHFSQAWITVFTSMFLHGNWLHIGSNMLYLWIFGNNVEDALGTLRFTAFYLLCGVVAALAQVMPAPQSSIPMVGASGAVAGVMGAYLVLYPHARVLTLVPIVIFFTTFELPAFVIIGYWALLQFVSAKWMSGGEMLGGGVAYFAHIGGFVAGLVLIVTYGGRSLLKR